MFIKTQLHVSVILRVMYFFLTGLLGQNRWHRVWQLGGTGIGQTALPLLWFICGRAF
jgi:hypothetical protein